MTEKEKDQKKPENPKVVSEQPDTQVSNEDVDVSDIETAEPGTRRGVDTGIISNPHDGATPTEEDLRNPPYSKKHDRARVTRSEDWDPHGGEKDEEKENKPKPGANE